MAANDSSPGRLRYLLQYLRGRGEPTALRELYRVLLLVAAALLVQLAFPAGPVRDVPVLDEGMIAQEDIVAEFDFPVLKGEGELQREQAAAAAAVPAIFEHRPATADSALTRVGSFFTEIERALAEVEQEHQEAAAEREDSGSDGDGAAAAGGGDAAQDPDAEDERSAADQELEAEKRRALRQVLSDHRIAASDDQLALLLSDRSRGRLAESVTAAFRNLLRSGVVAGSEVGVTTARGVILRAGDAETLIPRDSLPTMQTFYERAASRAPGELGVAGLQLYQRLLIRFAEPTIRLDPEATEQARAEARQAVDPVKYQVSRGSPIVVADRPVSAEQIERLRAYRAHMSELSLAGDGGGAIGPRLGSLLFNVLLLAVFGLMLRYFRPEIYRSNRSITLIWLLLLSVAGAAALIARAEAPPELIPIAFAALVLAALYDGAVALTAVFVLAALIVGRPPLLSVSVLFFTLIGGSAAALSGRVIRRRAQTWSLAAVIAAAYVLAALSLTLMLQSSTNTLVLSSMWGVINAIGATLLAVGILPLTESFTQITTEQTLLELADMNRPLLRRLSLEAPGTYAHSINVANLAEAAAREIGANALLVRVGIYYHDVGKLKKPQYFVENQPRGRNPHDKLKPATSANIVREHVEEGLEMLEEAGLPEVIKSFVTEHHGTQKIGFFWDRAKEMSPDSDLDLSDYVYPGPRPRSKETAIALLADSVESATRALQDPAPEKIRELVDRIVSAKLTDGQLDESPLTLHEIRSIKEQFIKVLTGMYHHRIDYPQPADEQEKRPEPVGRELV